MMSLKSEVAVVLGIILGTVSFIVASAVLIPKCVHREPDHVYSPTGEEVDCHGQTWDLCIATHCFFGYELLQWRDFGGSTYRCKSLREGDR